VLSGAATQPELCRGHKGDFFFLGRLGPCCNAAGWPEKVRRRKLPGGGAEDPPTRCTLPSTYIHHTLLSSSLLLQTAVLTAANSVPTTFLPTLPTSCPHPFFFILAFSPSFPLLRVPPHHIPLPRLPEIPLRALTALPPPPPPCLLKCLFPAKRKVKAVRNRAYSSLPRPFIYPSVPI